MRTRFGPFAVLILALLAGPAAVRAQAPGSTNGPVPDLAREDSLGRRLPSLEVRVQVGFDQRHAASVAGTWNPVTVFLTNNTDRELFGTLKLSTVRPGGDAGGSRVSRPVHLAPHEREQLVHSVVFVDSGDTRVEAALTGSQGESAAAPAEGLLIAPHVTRSIVVIGEATEEATDRTVTYPHDQLRNGGENNQTDLAPIVGHLREEHEGGYDTTRAHWQIAQAPVSILPERWIAYGGISDVVLTEPASVRAMNDAQYEALVAWVRSGGHLLIELASPKAWQTASSIPRLGQLLAADARTSLEMPRDTVINAFGGPRNLEGNMEVCPLTPRAAMEASAHCAPDLVTTDGRTLLVSFPMGLGRVMATGVSIADNRLMGNTPGYAAMLEQVFQVRMGGSVDIQRQDNAATVARQVDYELKSEELAQIPSHRVLLLFLAAYCILVGPVNRMVFARAGRPLGAWVVMPLIVIGFIGIALTKLSIKRPDSALLREISVVQLRDGDTTALARSYLSLYSPGRATYRVAYPNPDTAVHYLTNTEHRGLDRELLTFADGVKPDVLDPKATPAPEVQSYRLESITLPPRSRANLESVQRLSLRGTLSISTSGNGTLNVHNGLGVPLEGGVLLQQNGAALDLPAIRPGDTQAAEKTWTRGLDELLGRTGRDRQALNTVTTQLRQVGSSRVDLQACKLEYSIVSPK